MLELVDGPTLADRLALGALPIDEALRIAAQVANALEAAHERGVVPLQDHLSGGSSASLPAPSETL